MENPTLPTLSIRLSLAFIGILAQLYIVNSLEPLPLFSIDPAQLDLNTIDILDTNHNFLSPSNDSLYEDIKKFSEIAGLDNFGMPVTEKYHVVSPYFDSSLKYAPVTESTIPKALEQLIRNNSTLNLNPDGPEETELPSEYINDNSARNNNTSTNQPPYQSNPWDDLTKLLPECKDAKARGYPGQFSCCTIKNGDWMDPNIWSCHRAPTILDAVFIRHFVRISSVPDNLIVVRALWLIDSLENPKSKNTGGILRAGVLETQPCGDETSDWSDLTKSGIGLQGVQGMSKAFYLLLGGNFLADLTTICKVFKAKPFKNESDFYMYNNVIVEVKPPVQPISKNTMLSILKQSIQNINSYSEDNLDSLPTEGYPFVPLTPESFKPPVEDADIEPKIDSLEIVNIESDINLNPEPENMHIEDNFEYFDPPIVWEEGQNIPSLMRDLEEQALKNDLSGSSHLALNGSSTLRVEKNSGLLLFSNVSISIDGDLRNDGTFYIGESFLTTCLDKARTTAQRELCRIPSLDCTGSMIAMQPINLMWLQIGRGEIADTPSKDSKVWYGSLQYAEDLPSSDKSTLTFFGITYINSILPGFSLSFKRLGFPPFPAPPLSPKETQLIIQSPNQSSDLLLYIDIFDDDGYINCCEPFYGEEIAEFSVVGANIIFGRYQSIFKIFGDLENLTISEQILIRANTISMEENFFATSPIIPPSNSIATNKRTPQKKAGLNKDIVYFQCTNMCIISNQSFRPKPPFKYVQVQRTSPKMSILQNLG